jgi:hypothetical protein
MNANEPPQGGVGETPPAPVAVQQTTVIQIGSHKSVLGAVLLAFFFGPLGMLYATVPGGLVMFFVSIIVAIPTLGLGLLITIPLGTLWAGLSANSHNKRLEAVAAQHVVTSQATPAPPAPTSQALPPAPPDEPPPGTGAPVPDEEDVTVVLKSAARDQATCGSCGHEINPRARFCAMCGAAQTTA